MLMHDTFNENCLYLICIKVSLLLNIKIVKKCILKKYLNSKLPIIDQ